MGDDVGDGGGGDDGDAGGDDGDAGGDDGGGDPWG